MGQLSESVAKSLFPNVSTDIYDYLHCLNEEDNIERRILSSKKVLKPKVIVVGIDDRTTDRTEEIAKDLGAHTFRFKWTHNFATAKNLCVAKCIELGMRQGDIENAGGADWEFTSYDEEFFRNATNFFGRIAVREHGSVISSNRATIGRHHPLWTWKKPAHETRTAMPFLLLGKGQLDSGEHIGETFPVIGTATHYGLTCKGGYNGERYLRSSWYYTILVSLWNIEFKIMQPGYTCDTEEGMMNLIRHAYDNPNLENGLDYWMNQMIERCLNGDVPKGLSIYREHYLQNVEALENNL